MAVEIGTASGYADLRRRLHNFMCGYGNASAVTYTGTGNGTLTGGTGAPFLSGTLTTPTTITETWTITCTAEAANGGTFSVVGSVSGAQADATVGTPYDNGKLKFTIADGSIDFIVGDAFSFTTTQGAVAAEGQQWEYLGLDATSTSWFKGLGLTRTESIYIGTGEYSDSGTDIYNIWLTGALGFNAASAWNTQPGANGVTSYVYLWNTSMPYWFVVNGQRVIVVAKVSTTYRACYAGKFFPYGLPAEYGYPVYVGGEFTDKTVRWSSVSESIRHFSDPGYGGCMACLPDGNWYEFRNWYESSGESDANFARCIWPYSGGNSSNQVVSRLRSLRDNVDGTYTLLPLILSSNAPTTQILGELDGCYYVSGYNNAAENVITIDGDDYLVVQNIHRTNRYHYWALKLE